MKDLAKASTVSDARLVEQEAERESIEEASKLSAKLIYEVIRRDGEEELARPQVSLFWSGIAAGLLISFSVLGETIFRTFLPDTPFRHLIENLGYSFGFLLVIMGRMQLFTENTITTVLPLMGDPCPRLFGKVARLWAIVLGANVIGAFGAALMFTKAAMIPPEYLPAMIELSEHATGMGIVEGFARGIPAGILIAAIVWMLPRAEASGFFVILLFTWLIAAGDFAHVVAGSVEMAVLIVEGRLSVVSGLIDFFLPVLAGNIVGGTVIFTLIAWGQVKEEVQPEEREEA